MRLANDEMILTLTPNVTVILRASLRAAFHIHRTYGVPALSRAIDEGNLTAIADLITTACVNQSVWTEYATSESADIVPALLNVRAQLFEFIIMLFGGDQEADAPQTGAPMPFEEYFAKLFRVGSGWLRWPPEVTWNATISEIINARDGYLELQALKNGKHANEETIDVSSGMSAGLRDELNALGRAS